MLHKVNVPRAQAAARVRRRRAADAAEAGAVAAHVPAEIRRAAVAPEDLRPRAAAKVRVTTTRIPPAEPA
eukprot:12624136-Alexandrium_andersonii.AAC.1